LLQRITNRAFDISIRNDEDLDVALVLGVSLPNTYPKTLPHLSLCFGPSVPAKVQLATRDLVTQKPRTLLGSEMIFEIATTLQDLLDNVPRTAETPNLEEERTAQLALSQQMKQKDSATTTESNATDTTEEANARHIEEDEALSFMIEQAKTRAEKRKEKSPGKPDAAEIEANEGLQFDHIITAKDAEGSLAKFQVIHNRVRYRQGPVTKVSKVHIWKASRHLEPCLVLKECRFPVQGMQDILKKQLFDLDQRLEQMVQLPDNLNIIRPLSFVIKRGEIEYPDPEHWHVVILMELMPKGSMQDLLETVHVLDLEVFRAWALQLLEGLMFYHRHGIVHASVHLRNMLLVKADTGNTVVKLADASYQHAMHVLKNGPTADYSAATSTNWICPEVMNGNGGERLTASDIWDLGTALVQMLFGLKVQSVHRSPRDMIDNLDLSRSLEELLDHFFKSDSRRRPSAFELLPSAFFRNDDSILSQAQATQPSYRNDPSQRTFLEVSRRRRESATAPSISRYKNDFVEAGRLGRGGYGEVVRARNKLDGRFYAIKLIRSRSALALNDVLSEIMLLSQLNHPNVVRYFNAWLETGELQTDRRMQSDLSQTPSDSEDEDQDDAFEVNPSGLDFMSESGPNIVFESDSDDEAPKPRITSDADTDASLARASEDNNTAGDEANGDDGGEVDVKRDMFGPDTHQGRKRSMSSLPLSKSTLYIQMEYCERKVCFDILPLVFANRM